MNIEITYTEKVLDLLNQQKEDWELLKNNYKGLEKVRERTIDCGKYQITLQFNLERIRSTAAKTDAKSIRERPCFLCEKNRPTEQKGIPFNEQYTILINPFPVFPSHLTIALNEHLPQQIFSRFKDMLEFSKVLPDHVVFYNGPKCGASAPDHFHFQAGNINMLPVISEAKKIAKQFGDPIIENEQIKVNLITSGYMRSFILIEADNDSMLVAMFEKIHELLPLQEDDQEPMMNVLCTYDKGWQVIILPREKQRPWQFFAEGDEQILMSPASAEMGGLVILPREKDFEEISKSDLESIFHQVTIDADLLKELKAKLVNTK